MVGLFLTRVVSHFRTNFGTRLGICDIPPLVLNPSVLVTGPAHLLNGRETGDRKEECFLRDGSLPLAFSPDGQAKVELIRP